MQLLQDRCSSPLPSSVRPTWPSVYPFEIVTCCRLNGTHVYFPSRHSSSLGLVDPTPAVVGGRGRAQQRVHTPREDESDEEWKGWTDWQHVHDWQQPSLEIVEWHAGCSPDLNAVDMSMPHATLERFVHCDEVVPRSTARHVLAVIWR